MSKRYTMGRDHDAHTATNALKASLLNVDAGSPSWGPMRAEAVCLALFCALTESQQDRVLRALGWEPEPSDVSPLPAPAPTPGELEYASWLVRPAPGCTRRNSWGGCHCKTAGQRAVCMYRAKP